MPFGVKLQVKSKGRGGGRRRGGAVRESWWPKWGKGWKNEPGVCVLTAGPISQNWLGARVRAQVGNCKIESQVAKLAKSKQ